MKQPQKNLLQRIYPDVNTRVTAPFLLITIIIAGLGVFIVTRLVTSSIDERLSNQLVSSAQAATNAMVTLETEHLGALRAMIFTDGIVDAVRERQPQQLAALLNPIIANQGLDTVVIYDQTGAMIFSSGFDLFAGRLLENPVGADLMLPSVPLILAGSIDELGDKFVDVVVERSAARAYISAPLPDENNQVIAVIAVAMDSNRILRRLTEQSLASVTLYDQNGQILNSSFRQPDYSQISIAPDAFAALLANTVNLSPVMDLSIGTAPYRVLYTPFLIRSQRIGLLAVALPTDFVIEQISVSRNIFIVLFAGLFLAVTVIGLLIARSIVRPISRLVDTTRAIREGDLSRRVDLRLPDEIGELSQSFDQMTDRLVQRNTEISQLYVEQLQETARRDAILSSISDAVVVRTTGEDTVLMNPAGQELANQLLNHPQASRLFYQIQSHPERLIQPVTVTLAERHFSTLATPIYTGTSDPLGYIIVFRDITALVNAERLKDEMILQLSHELRTPLASARGYTELLQVTAANRLDAQSSDFVAKSVEQLGILERMVNQVIEVNAIMAKRVEIEIERVNLVALLREQIAAFRPLTRQKRLRVTLHLPAEEIWIDGDSYQLAQVFEHVLRNAVSYTMPDGRIEVAIERLPEWVEVYVIDTGVGIAADEIERVFDRMYRGRSAEAGKTDTRGLGLGLYISREIITAHGGTILLDSEPGKGTIVNIRLRHRLSVKEYAG